MLDGVRGRIIVPVLALSAGMALGSHEQGVYFIQDGEVRDVLLAEPGTETLVDLAVVTPVDWVGDAYFDFDESHPGISFTSWTQVHPTTLPPPPGGLDPRHLVWFDLDPIPADTLTVMGTLGLTKQPGQLELALSGGALVGTPSIEYSPRSWFVIDADSPPTFGPDLDYEVTAVACGEYVSKTNESATSSGSWGGASGQGEPAEAHASVAINEGPVAMVLQAELCGTEGWEDGVGPLEAEASIDAEGSLFFEPSPELPAGTEMELTISASGCMGGGYWGMTVSRGGAEIASLSSMDETTCTVFAGENGLTFDFWAEDSSFTGYGTFCDECKVTMAATPEPATLAVLGLGGFVVLRRRRRHR